jgi:high-affinity iron transporter
LSFPRRSLSLLVGGLELVSAEFPQKQQELFEGIVGLIAVGILSSMVFWMRKVARSIKSSLHTSSIMPLPAPNTRSRTDCHGVFAVAREGLETVFFLLAVSSKAKVRQPLWAPCSV